MGNPTATIILVLSTLVWTSAQAGVLNPASRKIDLKGKPLQFSVLKPGSALSGLNPASSRADGTVRFQSLVTVRQARDRNLLNARMEQATPVTRAVLPSMAPADGRKQAITPRPASHDPVLVFPAEAVVTVKTK
jgi:hypothetical protein